MEKKGTKRGRISLAVMIIVSVILIPILIVNLVLIVKGSVNSDTPPDVFGIAPLAVTSGSMEGEREVFSKAIVLSLALMADRLRRSCRIVFFSDQTEVVELENVYEDLPSLETFLCRTFHGGSDMGCAMRDAVTALMREDFRYADLLWISDFEMEALSPVWVQYVDELKQRGMRLYAVSFGRRAEQSYLAYYSQMLDKFRESLVSEVAIYVQSVTPVRPGVSQPGLYRERIQRVNYELAKLAVE